LASEVLRTGAPICQAPHCQDRRACRRGIFRPSGIPARRQWQPIWQEFFPLRNRLQIFTSLRR